MTPPDTNLIYEINPHTIHDTPGGDSMAHQFHPLIQNATGNDIYSFPAAIQDRLDVLARTAALLGLDVPTRSAYTHSLSKLSSDRLRVQLHLIHLRSIEKELLDAIDLARHQSTLTASWGTYVEEALVDTTSLELQNKSMSAKAKDYQRELSNVTSENPSENREVKCIKYLCSRQDKIRLAERDVKLLKARLKVFEGLPPSLELAKAELASARENQLKLLKIREKLLGRMTHGLS